MRDSSAWIEKLRKLMGGKKMPSVGMKFAIFARTELMLYALHKHFPNHPIRKAHLLLQGYREPDVTDKQWHILQHMRHLTPEFHSSISWEIALRNYKELACESESGLFGFEIDHETNSILKNNKMFKDRYSLYEECLTKILSFSKQRYNPAPVGVYEFSLNPQQICTVKIPSEFAAIGTDQVPNIPKLRLSKKRAPITVSLKALIEKGDELKPVLGYDAGKVLQQSTYWDIQHNCHTENISIVQTGHILGPTGSGKSTLIDCLVAYLTDQGSRVAIATNSVGEVQEWLTFAQKLGVKAVPIIGDSERHHHLSRLNQATMFSNEQQPFTHPGFRWLSQACPLFELVKETSSINVPQSNHEKRYRPPCFNRLKDIVKPHKIYDCPLATVCPRHIQAHELDEARLIIGTLPGFIQKKVARHNLTANVTLLEYLALTSDLFIIDEVDLAQPKLDETFYPTVTLASFRSIQDTWTRIEAYQHLHGPLEGEVVVPGRLVDPYLEQAEDQRHLANRGIGALLYLMRDIANTASGKISAQNIEKLLKQYVKDGKLFSSWSFFEDLAQQLSGKAYEKTSKRKIPEKTQAKYKRSYKRYREIFKRIQDNAVRPDASGLNSADIRIVERLALVSGSLLAGDLLRSIPHPDCYSFIQETRWDTELKRFEDNTHRFEENLAKLLQLAIYTSHVLGALGKHISARYRASTTLDSSFPVTPPRDFDGLLPNSPVGSVTSAQFKDDQLRIFRGISLGRSLLSHWYSIFNIDGLAPANLMITSATSYSGAVEQSYPFHVQLPPTLLIEPPSEKSQTVAHESEFFYCPVVDKSVKPIRISGKQGDERQDSIDKMVMGLCRSSKQSKSLFDQFQDYLEKNVGSDRKNLLIVTNSYAEAQTFYNALKPPYQDRASYVVADGRWSSGDQVARSKLTEFPRQDKELLIAPIGAISRAVNLMHPITGEPYFGGIVICSQTAPKSR